MLQARHGDEAHAEGLESSDFHPYAGPIVTGLALASWGALGVSVWAFGGLIVAGAAGACALAFLPVRVRR